MADQGTRTVLLVDDEHAIVEALGEFLAWDGYTVKVAANGRAALQVLRDGPVDVVVLDMMMPAMDGLQAAAAIRADVALQHIPIVLMSAAPIPRRERPDWDASLQKPFDLDSVRRTLTHVLSTVRPSGGVP